MIKSSLLVVFVLALLLGLSSAQQTTTVSMIIKFDDFPGETSWVLSDDQGIVASRAALTYDGVENFGFAVEFIDLTVGRRYEFLVEDSYGDGMAGFIEVYAGRYDSLLEAASSSDLLVRIGEFTGFEHPTVAFTVRAPAAAAPTPVPNSNNNWPTAQPTICGRFDDDFADAFEQTPIFTTTAKEFGAGDALCTRHSSYKECTNERGEDCQWVFLTQNERMGKCRVDPVSKCLEVGNCICNTEDFHGGSGDGILFHAPISVTARDISPNFAQVTYWEDYQFPTTQNTFHPQDESFFISKVDFTGRKLHYEFAAPNALGQAASRTVMFKLHYTYMDVDMVGTIFRGLGLVVSINTATFNDQITINGRTYTLPTRLRKWTCAQIAITDSTLYVAGQAISRNLGVEDNIAFDPSSLTLGSFSGELFDVRIYSGTLPAWRVTEVGAKCAASPNDPAALVKRVDIDVHFDREGCDIDDRGWYGEQPANGRQTYGSGAFATLWLHPAANPLTAGEFEDVAEGRFDEGYYFQHQKIQSYMWERMYFELDMIAFVLDPYRMFTQAQVPQAAASTFNNPCRFIHQRNNVWDFPLYGAGIVPKWNAGEFGVTDNPNEPYDLGSLYHRGAGFPGFNFALHELYHRFHFSLDTTYQSGPSGWLQESAAEFAVTHLFPGTTVFIAGVSLAISWPLALDPQEVDVQAASPHFWSTELSLDQGIRGGHPYASWVVWWFLSQHAGLPHLLGQMFSVDRKAEAYWQGKIAHLRMLVESNNMDLGDVLSIFIAHYRTWDFPNGDLWVAAEIFDLEQLKRDEASRSAYDLEERKVTATINANSGTSGQFVAGPFNLRPGAFGWNSLTSRGVRAGAIIGVSLRWDNNMGFAANTTPARIVTQHAGCDADARFYNSMIVLHNEATGDRRYWKLKGKAPPTLHIYTGNAGPVTLHVLMIPTPVADYVAGRQGEEGQFVTPVPAYSYQYKVDVLNDVPPGSWLTQPAAMENGIVKFETATPGWWPVRCQCLDDPLGENGRRCGNPTYDFTASCSSTSVI